MRIIFKFLAFMLAMNLIFNALACSSRRNEIKKNDLSIPVGFVFIKGGSFIMGSPDSESERFGSEVLHSITVGSFYMSKYTVTQKEYKEVTGENPSYFKGDNLPVETVSWLDAVEYCNKRSIQEGLTPVYILTIIEEELTNINVDQYANGYRLPTEAEWEYACRAGTTTPFNTGNNITTNQANYDGNFPYTNNAKGIFRDKTTPVGSFAPNSWGLYDMHGNIWEWCSDFYGAYNKKNQKDPWGMSGAYIVMRGGSWSDGGQLLRSAYRDYGSIRGARGANVGFRVVRLKF